MDLLPMQATSGPVPQEPGWAFEFTWDGVRSFVEVGDDGVRLVGGRTGNSTDRYPELEMLPNLIKRRVLLDGKIVALDAWGKPSFTRLAQRMHLTRPSAAVLRRVPVVFYAFDLLRLDDRSTLDLPYRQRRELLTQLQLTGGLIALPPYFLGLDGQAVLDTAAEYGLHGVVAKRVDSPYRPGRRSHDWIQTTLRRRQDVVIGGWLPGRIGPGQGIGSLLLGVPSDAGLRYVGRVFAGFSDFARKDMARRLAELTRRTSPFAGQLPEQIAPDAQWVAPTLLGQVTYERWTQHGRLKHPVWAGLRPGKHPAAVQGPVLVGDAAETSSATRKAGGQRAGVPDDAAGRDKSLARPEVSPHFFYNSLTTIAALVRTDPTRARDLLMDFAGFSRYYLRPVSGLTTLADELQNVDRYLTLEGARFEERLQVRTRIVPQVLGVKLPSLTLHPVVENAVRHGIEVLPEGGILSISAVDADAYCSITVAADGPWVTQLVDLSAVDARLRAAFGDDYLLTVGRVDGAGDTTGAAAVSIRIPKINVAAQ